MPDPQATDAWARALALRAQIGDCIALKGDLGAGKTAFARSFIQTLAPGVGNIASPTFMLAQSYPSLAGVIWHYDLYRLKVVEELMEIGLEDSLQGAITLIEWPEIARGFLPPETLWLTLSEGKTAQARILEVAAPPAWRARLDGLMEKK